jgi:hypothetical protein
MRHSGTDCCVVVDQNKKLEERQYLERLTLADPIVFDLPWEDSETPDFWCKSGGSLTSLELVRYVQNGEAKPPSVALEKYINRVRLRCVRLCEEHGLEASKVTVWIQVNVIPSENDEDRLAQALFEVIRIKLPEAGLEVTVTESDLPQLAQNLGVREMTVFRSIKCWQACHWTFPQLGYVADLDSVLLNRIIADKITILEKNYKSKFDVKWLVVLFQAFGSSSWPSVPDEIKLNIRNCPFDKIWIFKLSSLKLLEIKIDRR